MRWLLVFWLFVLSAVAFLDRVNISIAGSAISSEYHLGKVQLGWVFSAFLMGYAMFQTVGGRLADRFGSRRVLAAGVIWWGIFTALTAAVPSGIASALALFITIRFLLGAGEAIIYPASNQFVARWIPVRKRGIANGWIFAGVGVGAGLTPAIVTYAMLNYGWRASFWFCAIVGAVAGMVWYVAARDTPEQHPLVSQAEREEIRHGLEEESQAPAVGTNQDPVAPAVLVPWSNVLRSQEVLGITLSYFSYGYVAWIFFSWFYIYLAEARGLNLKASAVLAMVPFLAMAVTCPIGGFLNDFFTLRRGPRVGRCGLAAFAMALTAVVSGAELLLVSECRHRGCILGIGFRLHEHGRADRRSCHGFADPLPCTTTGLERIVPGCGGNQCLGGSCLAARGSHRQIGKSARTHGITGTPDSHHIVMTTAPAESQLDNKEPKALATCSSSKPTPPAFAARVFLKQEGIKLA